MGVTGTLRRLACVVAIVAVVVAAGACGGGAGPEVPLGPDGRPDAVLAVGRDVWGQKCATCHGNAGQGGRGKKLNDGAVFALHPEIDSLLTVIAEGKGQGMPAFGDTLDDDEIVAVARYVREVLNDG